MKSPLVKIIPFLILLFPICLFAQSNKTADLDITGLWKGSLYNDSTKSFLPYEIAISEEKGKLVGYSYTLFEDSGRKEVGVKRIKIKKKDGEVIIEDVEMISNNFSIAPPKKVKVQSILTLYVGDTSMEMRGRWSTNKTWEYRQLTGNLQVKRSVNFKEMALFEKLQELKLEKDLSFVKADIKTQTEVAVVEKPNEKKKMIGEVPAQPADVDNPIESKNPITEKNKEIAIEKKPEKVAPNTNEVTVAKTMEVKPKETAAKNLEDPVVKIEPTKPAVKTTEQSIAKTTVIEKEASIGSSQPANKVNDRIVKDSISKNILPVDQLLATTTTSEKKSPVPASKQANKANDLLAKDSISKNIKPVEQSVVKTTLVEKPAVITTPIPTKNPTGLSAKDSVGKKSNSPEDLAIKPAAKTIAPATKPIERKKDVVVAPTIKKENQQPATNQPKANTPAPAANNTTPVASIKTPAIQKDNKPVTDIAQKPASNEKPIQAATATDVKVAEPAMPVAPTAIVVAAGPKKEIPAIAITPIVKAAANVAERKMKNEQEVFFESDSLVLTLYDNGEVDGDTVSVLMNGQIIFAKQGLTTKANTKTIYIDKSMTDSLSMVMYAESLGSIPPNTGLLIIMDGEKRYEVRFSADLQTNAAILLRRKPKEQ